MNSQLRPIGLQLYTVREAMSQDWRGTLEQVAAAGYVGVETAGFSYAPIIEVKSFLESLNLAVTSAHVSLPLGEDQTAVLRQADVLGCQRLIIGGTAHDEFQTEDQIKRLADQYNRASRAMVDHGYRLGIHNHWWEFGVVNGRSTFDIFAEALDEAVFFEIDTYWAQTARQNPVELIRQLGSRVPLLHIKDGPAEDFDDDMVAVGSGRMDFAPIIKAAKHTEWLIVELDRCATDMVTAVRQSINYLTAQQLGKGRNA